MTLSNQTLYGITNELIDTIDQIMNNELSNEFQSPSIDPNYPEEYQDPSTTNSESDNSAVLRQQYEELQLAFNNKLTSCGGYLLHKQSKIEEIKNRIKSMNQRLLAEQKKTESFEKYIIYAMDKLGIPSLQTDNGNIKISDSYAVNVGDLELIPDEYKKTKTTVLITPDKIKIKEAIKQGTDIPGASLMVNRNLHIK